MCTMPRDLLAEQLADRMDLSDGRGNARDRAGVAAVRVHAALLHRRHGNGWAERIVWFVNHPNTTLAMAPDLPAQLFTDVTCERLRRIATVDPDLVLTEFQSPGSRAAL